MKTLSLVVAFCAVLVCSVSAYADTPAKWMDNDVTIDHIEPAQNGFAWIYLVNQSAAMANVCGSQNVLLSNTRGTAEGRDRMYKTLLAAFLAGKPVKFKLVSSTDASGNCEINRFQIKN